MYYQKNILKLKILYLNLLFDKLYSDHKVLKLKKRIKVKPGTSFNFFLFSYFFQVIQDKKFYFCKSNFNKILKYFDFKILKDVFIYFSYLLYLNKKKKKYSTNNLSYFNITYTYLMQDKGILLNFIKLVVNTIIFHFFNFFFKSEKGLIDFIFIKKSFLTCFFTNLYFFFLKDLTLVKYYNKVFIDYHLLGMIRKSKKNLKLRNDLCSSKNFYKQHLVENLLTNSQKLDGFLSLYKKFFIQDIVYFFNDQFIFTDDRLDLYLDTQLSFFFKSDVFLDFQNLILSVDWLNKKASIVKEKPGIFFLKTKVFKFLKKFSLLLCDDYNSLDLNFNAVEFSGNIYGALRVDAKKKFNLYAIFLSKILSLVVEREELTKRRKFNLRL